MSKRVSETLCYACYDYYDRKAQKSVHLLSEANLRRVLSVFLMGLGVECIFVSGYYFRAWLDAMS